MPVSDEDFATFKKDLAAQLSDMEKRLFNQISFRGGELDTRLSSALKDQLSQHVDEIEGRLSSLESRISGVATIEQTAKREKLMNQILEQEAAQSTRIDELGKRVDSIQSQRLSELEDRVDVLEAKP